jgi:hypothetical protein
MMSVTFVKGDGTIKVYGVVIVMGPTTGKQYVKV